MNILKYTTTIQRTMRMGKERLIILSAVILLLLGTLSNIYVYAMQRHSVPGNVIEINGKSINIEELFDKYELKTIENKISGESFTGIPLDAVIREAGITNPEKFSYNIIGSDGYSKVVKWENVEKGVLTDEMRVAFEDLPKAFMVREVIKIEVVE